MAMGKLRLHQESMIWKTRVKKSRHNSSAHKTLEANLIHELLPILHSESKNLQGHTCFTKEQCLGFVVHLFTDKFYY